MVVYVEDYKHVYHNFFFICRLKLYEQYLLTYSMVQSPS